MPRRRRAPGDACGDGSVRVLGRGTIASSAAAAAMPREACLQAGALCRPRCRGRTGHRSGHARARHVARARRASRRKRALSLRGAGQEPASAGSERARQAEHVLGDVRQDQVGRDRRHLVEPRLAELALDVVFVRRSRSRRGTAGTRWPPPTTPWRRATSPCWLRRRTAGARRTARTP